MCQLRACRDVSCTHKAAQRVNEARDMHHERCLPAIRRALSPLPAGSDPIYERKVPNPRVFPEVIMSW